MGILDSQLVKNCKAMYHTVDTCNACGGPYCLTERKCLSGGQPIETTPELLAMKFRRDLTKLEARNG